MNKTIAQHCKRCLVWLALICLAGLTTPIRAESTNASLQHAEHFEAKITVTAKYEYFLFLPKDYGKTRRRWPLMLFLHGAGDSGTNMDRVKILGPPKIVESKPDFPFILVSPQSPERSWNLEFLNALLDEVIHKYRVDTDRVYLTGASMGGSATWAFAASHPDKLAAIAVVSGSGNPDNAKTLARLPIWVFHGAKDPTVPVAKASAMVDAIKAAGGNIKLTIYPDGKHDAWTETYDNPELYTWLLEQKRQPTAGVKSGAFRFHHKS